MQTNFRRRIFVFLLVAQGVLVIALAITLGRINNDAEVTLTERLLSANASESAEAIRSHLEPAEAIVDLTADLLTASDLEDAALENAFSEALQRTPQISGVFLASPDGDFFFVNREDEGFSRKLTNVEGAQRTTVIDLFDESGNRTDSFEDPTDTYDPTGRPWFIEAVDVETNSIWTEPYVFFTSQQLGITSARAVTRDTGLAGVVGVDVELGELSDFLAELNRGNEGGTVLVDELGNVIAHPNSELLREPEGDGFRPVSIAEFGDTYAQSAAALLLNEMVGVDEGVIDFFDEDQGESKVAFESVELGEVTWTLAVYAPSDSIVSELVDARGRERSVAAIVGLIGILLAGVIMYPATRDIDELAESASTDELTGLANRRTIMSEASALARGTGSRAVALIDICLLYTSPSPRDRG